MWESFLWKKYYLCFSTSAVRVSSCCTPIICSTAFPSLKRRRVGILMTRNCAARSGFSSTFTFPTVTPVVFSNSASIGIAAWHGPHHSAQKSTSIIPLSVSEAKLELLSSIYISLISKERIHYIFPHSKIQKEFQESLKFFWRLYKKWYVDSRKKLAYFL